MVQIEARLAQLGIDLPDVIAPKGNYALAVRTGNLLFLAGHIPLLKSGVLMTGKVGADKSLEEGQEAAQVIAINLLATLKSELGDLDKVKRIVKLVGFVNCVDGFSQQPMVVNGASDFFVQVFGDKGVHARSAVGTNALPLNIPVEIEAIVEVED
ncbi:hypothetical protein NSK_007969 [Nannochloropsis salina CCMP1776]|uniref:Endoribonuclease L-PSP/chorismate mutase-like domain-containing protein n=1 Tax=Nannochloropsis salina CCMP1776 TaxID=1027361 RepID=A0A4D9CNR0_9STRA|nr:hypothetical protein NSK_007969 [Nannochloropsis salina CCMP1776]|eukprot:TFJ80792.1 hypothetical protein NSK_007969 [Nannochloropsis salina CCMP1776]